MSVASPEPVRYHGAPRSMPSVLLVVPCYNEAARLDRDAFVAFVAAHPHVRVLFVDDGSSDGTGALLAELAARAPARLAATSLPSNCGKAEAVRQGFLRAFAAEPAPDLVGFWDADLATPLGDVDEFARVLAGRDQLLAVFGARVNLLGRSVKRRLVRHYVGRVFATAASALLRLPIYDTQCGAKLFRNTELVRSLFAAPFVSRWIFDVEIIARLCDALAARGGPRPHDVIFEFPLLVWRDVAGSKLRLRNFVTVFFDLCRIAWRTRVRR